MSFLKRFRLILGFLGASLVLTGCKSCGGSTDGGGYSSPTPAPRAASLLR